MKKTVGNPIMLLLICLLSFAFFTVQVTACPDPECTDDDDCPDCYKCESGECVDYDQCGAGCGPCRSCVDCWCVSDCYWHQYCCNGSCCDNPCCPAGHCCNFQKDGKYCCGGGCCDLGIECCDGECCPEGQECCGGECYDPYVKKCCPELVPYLCWKNYRCCEGNCCDPDTETCCDGECCDKVWTKETHTAIEEFCPSVADCYEPGVGCDGVKVTDQQSYDSCLNVGVGESEHCECNEEEQVVGYEYTCQEDWDWSMMAECAFEAWLCFYQCYGAWADPASCSDCLGMLTLDCCGGDTCHMCDFLESCDPLYPEEIKKSVFVNFGC